MATLDNIINNFSVDNLKDFFGNKISSFKQDDDGDFEYLFEDNKNILNKYEDIQKLGEAVIEDSNDLLVISVKSLSPLTDKSGKKNQFDIAKTILKEDMKDAAFFIFYDDDGNFRFSLIRTEYIGTKTKYSSFKRYTYYVSKDQTNKTFISQISKTDFMNLDSIQEAFSVEPLTKEFYEKLQYWYFWAIKNVTFPSEPAVDINDKDNFDLINEHRAKNVIRLLTRFLFVWFIKQKHLIPDDLFDLEVLQKKILKKISPYHNEGLFKEENRESIYYKAILQNLFFATLNCPIKSDSLDSRERGFRGDESYGKHRGIDYLMRYKNYFKDPAAFLKMVNSVVPFLNGGLFECLDDKDNNTYIDGFSDNMSKTKGKVNKLIVPDYLFFGLDETTDLSADLDPKSKKYSDVTVGGLIELLKSYNFTIDENEPNDVEVALDPELLGKVFENLLASYNPETKTTARKQTGSFYTPRTIVDYMVDESLIAHLKNSIDWDIEEKELDDKLHQLVSYSSVQPFENNEQLSVSIIHSLDNCKILDPACGSGAFPMGVLHKMVHILQKVDPDNIHWQELQLVKAQNDTKEVFANNDKKERDQLLLDINNAFDQTINNPDYARKLFLIENCIYGVDIQPVATQISKLRFFISLVVEQKVNIDKDNFGIRPLPNLETRFVTANTLIGIDKPDLENVGHNIFNNDKLKKLEEELKAVRHKLFGAKTKATKVKYRKLDEELRNQIADELKLNNWDIETADKLASWDPYNQNVASSFFDPEWMFDVKDGFDIVIGNPPYVDNREIDTKTKIGVEAYYTNKDSIKPNLYLFFIEKGISLLLKKGILSFINPAYYLSIDSGFGCRKFLTDYSSFDYIVDVSYINIFEKVSTYTIINQFIKNEKTNYKIRINKCKDLNNLGEASFWINSNEIMNDNLRRIPFNEMSKLLMKIEKNNETFDSVGLFNWGTSKTGYGKLKIKKDKFTVLKSVEKDKYKPIVQTADIKRYFIEWKGEYIPKNIYSDRITREFSKTKLLIARVTKSIQCSYSDDNYYVGKSTLITDLKIPYQFILGFINSKIVNFWYSNKFESTHMTGGYLRFDIPYLKQIPLPKFNKYLIPLVSILEYNVKNSFIDEIIDALVFELYFPDHMKERKIDILQFVEKDIDDVMKGLEFEVMKDTQKEKVIAELHNRWSDPNSEIVKRMNSFAEKSPDILKPILES